MSAYFETTNWTLILSAADGDSPQGRQSVERLCCAYWQPLYAYVRNGGRTHEDAQDLTQAFFQHLLGNELHAGAHPSGGRFRSWLIALLKNFMHNERRHDHALKRGGPNRQDIPIEDAQHEIIDTLTPDQAFERKWAHTVLANAMERLRLDSEQQGSAPKFAALQPLLFGLEKGEGSMDECAAQLGLTVNATRVALSRLRQRFRELLLVEVSRLVTDPAEADDEIAHLMRAVRGS